MRKFVRFVAYRPLRTSDGRPRRSEADREETSYCVLVFALSRRMQSATLSKLSDSREASTLQISANVPMISGVLRLNFNCGTRVKKYILKA